MNDRTGPDIRLGVAYNNTPPDPALIRNALNGLYRVREGDTLRYSLNPEVIGNDELRELLQRYNAFLPKDERLVFNEEVIWLHGVPSQTLAFSGLKSLAALEKIGADISSSNNVMAASHINCLAADAQAESVTDSLKKGFKSIPKEQVRLSGDKQLISNSYTQEPIDTRALEAGLKKISRSDIALSEGMLVLKAHSSPESVEAIMHNMRELVEQIHYFSEYHKDAWDKNFFPPLQVTVNENSVCIEFKEPCTKEQLARLAQLGLDLPGKELLIRYGNAVNGERSRE